MSLSALVQGQVLDIYREEIPGKIKDGQEQKFWEKLVYQMLCKYEGRPAELVNLEIFAEKGQAVVEPKMQDALMTRAQISVLISLYVDSRGEKSATMGVRIIQVDPIVNCLLPTGGAGVRPAPASGSTSGNSKTPEPATAGAK